MSHKAEQLASTIRDAVQDVIDRGLQDPRVSGLVTVTNVRVPQDLSVAVISVSVMPEDREKLALHGLESASSFLRREVGRRVRVRSLPRFQFKIDKSLKRQAAVLAAINKASDELREQDAARPPATDQPRTTEPMAETDPVDSDRADFDRADFDRADPDREGPSA